MEIPILYIDENKDEKLIFQKEYQLEEIISIIIVIIIFLLLQWNISFSCHKKKNFPIPTPQILPQIKTKLRH